MQTVNWMKKLTHLLKKRLGTSFASFSVEQSNVNTSFFCDKVISNDQMVQLHRAATKNLDSKVRMMATELRDSKLLAKLSVSDMTASDAVYHKKYLTSLHTRYRYFVRKKGEDGANENMKPESVALAELISYLEEMKCTDGSHTLLKLSDLMKLYTEHLAQLGGDTSKRIDSTHIKDKLLAQLPQLEVHTCNREVVLSFKEDIGEALLHACKQSSDDDAVTLMRAAQIVHKNILQRQYRFDGSLVDESYNNAPPSLTALMQMILAGTNIQKQTAINKGISVPVQSLTQLVTFNTVK